MQKVELHAHTGWKHVGWPTWSNTAVQHLVELDGANAKFLYSVT